LPEPRSSEAALRLFKSLPPVTIEEMIGSWQGRVIPTGHPLDELLTASGWCGKVFEDAEIVHPLVIGQKDDGRFYASPDLLLLTPWLIDLASRSLIPTGFARFILPRAMRLLKTRKPKARLRMVEFEGITSAAMIYDHQPIIDHFRKIDDNRVMGLFDLKEDPAPLFFQLDRRVAKTARQP
jgi:hypothetical protein